MVTSGTYKGFCGIQDQWWCIFAAQIEETPDTKSKNSLVFFMNTENGKYVTVMNIKTEKPKFFGTKTEKNI